MAAPDTLSSCSSAAAFSPFASYMYPVRPRYMSKENATHFGWQITQMKCTKCAPFISCRRAAPAMPPCHVASANSPPLAALPQQSAEVTCATICLGTRWQKYEAQNMSQLTQATGRPQKTLHELHELPASETATPPPPCPIQCLCRHPEHPPPLHYGHTQLRANLAQLALNNFSS